jgi:hypothetical protein
LETRRAKRGISCLPRNWSEYITSIASDHFAFKDYKMAPKGKAADKGGAAKGKGKGKAEEEEKGGKVKGAQFINVRHILVRLLE